MAFHIHVPKPLHGWKAFFNEITVIVLGVLIALGLEQCVEWLHWQHKVEDGKERLAFELLTNGAFMAEQVMITPCVQEQLDRLAARLAASKQMLDPAPLLDSSRGKATLRIPIRAWPLQTWEALQQDGTSNHMPDDLQARIGVIYQMTGNIRDMSVKSEDGLGNLRLLGDPITLSPDLRGKLLGDIRKESQFWNSTNLYAKQVLRSYREIEFAPDASDIEARRAGLSGGNIGDTTAVQYCARNNLPLADWRAETARAQLNPISR